MGKTFFTVVIASLLLLSLSGQVSQAQSETQKIEFGIHFTSLIEGDPTHFPRGAFTRFAPGVGGRFAFNATAKLAFETELNYFPREQDRIGEGQKTQGLFGVKVGVRQEKVGFFGKIRPGFVHFSDPVLESPEEEFIRRPIKKTRFALDFGGVIELYPSNNTLLRFDFGDTLIRFPDVRLSISEPGFPTRRSTLEGGFTHNFQFSAGVGIRF